MNGPGLRNLSMLSHSPKPRPPKFAQDRQLPNSDRTIFHAYVEAKLKYPGMRIRALGATGRTIVPSERVVSVLDILPPSALHPATSDHQSAPPSLAPHR